MKRISHITDEIKQKFYPTYSPDVTVITYKDGQEFYGFLQDFNDSDELLKIGQCRFVPNNNAIAFQKELAKTGKTNPIHSIIIDLPLTKSIKLVNRINKHISEQLDVSKYFSEN